MHILVTGGAGFIGTTLVPRLLEHGHQVTVLDRFYFGKGPFRDLETRFADRLVLRRGDVRSVTSADFGGVDAVVDLAGISNDPSCELDPNLTRSVNLEGSVRVATEAVAAGVRRIVYASSCSVYGHGAQEQLTEQSPLHPVSTYAKCKAESEVRLMELAEKSGACITPLRFATLFGLSGRMRFDLAVNVMTRNAYVDRKITVEGGGRQWRPFVHVRDVARCIHLVLESDPKLVGSRVFNVGGDVNNQRIISLAYRIRDLLPGTELLMAGTDPDLRDYNVSFERIRKELGFVPEFTIDDGIREIADAIRNGDVDPVDRKAFTLRQYVFLAEVERVFAELALDGSVLS